MAKDYLFVGIVECRFIRLFFTQVALFHQPHPFLSHTPNMGITSNPNMFFVFFIFAEIISSWICNMNYLYPNFLVHVCTPLNSF